MEFDQILKKLAKKKASTGEIELANKLLAASYSKKKSNPSVGQKTTLSQLISKYTKNTLAHFHPDGTPYDYDEMDDERKWPEDLKERFIDWLDGEWPRIHEDRDELIEKFLKDEQFNQQWEIEHNKKQKESKVNAGELLKKYAKNTLAHFHPDGTPYDYDEISYDEETWPEELKERWMDWLVDDHYPLHEDDDREDLIEKFLKEQQYNQKWDEQYGKKQKESKIKAGDILKKYALELGEYSGGDEYDHEIKNYIRETNTPSEEIICERCNEFPVRNICDRCNVAACEKCMESGGELCVDCRDEIFGEEA